MVYEGKNVPFFSDFNADLDNITAAPEWALDDFIAREPFLYKKTLFRAFLGFSRKECEKMTMGEYINAAVMLENVLKLWHAPFMPHDK